MATPIENSYKILTAPLSFPLRLRNLALGDYKKGFLELLGELTVVGDVTYEDFLRRFSAMESLGNLHHVFVVENEQTKTIVATATLMIEPKFVHGCSSVGHMEDVVVTESARGQHLGLKIVSACITKALECGCYKVILDCKADRTGFYSKLGFEVKEQQMALYFRK